MPAVFSYRAWYVEFGSKRNSLTDIELSEIVRLLPNTTCMVLDSTAVTDAGLQSVCGLTDLGTLSL